MLHFLRRLRPRAKDRRPEPQPPRARPAVESLEDRCLPSHAGGDAVIHWNRTLLDAIRAESTSPPVAARDMAIVEVAVFDAVNSIEPTYAPYRVHVPAAPGASPQAAAIEAAFQTLSTLFPAERPLFDQQLHRSLAHIPGGPAKVEGLRVGRAVARKCLAMRQHDGLAAQVSYTPGTAPGEWRPTPPKFAPALLPGWPAVAGFGIKSGAQFRPAGPPALTSAQYAQAFAEVEALGDKTSTVRTPDQTQIALFWADNAGTATPPGHWNEIAEQIAARRHTSLLQNARLFAVLDMTLADAGIAAWDAKYTYNFWRPVTAIPQAGADGNPATTADPTWAPLLATPNFPSYVSGHSTFSAAACAVLTRFFGRHVHFRTTSDALPGVVRSFRSFAQAADEAGMSRIYAGIHWQFDNQDGLALGTAVGNYDLKHLLRPL
jgi:membrane-associated phospholipid phosphatase